MAIFLARVVCVGGDGMFSEILHGLIIRTQTDHGVDRDRPDSELVPCPLRVGIIPAGESATPRSQTYDLRHQQRGGASLISWQTSKNSWEMWQVPTNCITGSRYGSLYTSLAPIKVSPC